MVYISETDFGMSKQDGYLKFSKKFEPNFPGLETIFINYKYINYYYLVAAILAGLTILIYIVSMCIVIYKIFKLKMQCNLFICKNLHKTRYHEGLDIWSHRCTICMKRFMLKEKIEVLSCKHAYHGRCINPWFYTYHNYNCPTCNEDMLGDMQDLI
ncbi:hypothetical protein A3Q56_05947 [Intoshia linei]|uniref:RING-type domain-containing protein n=1 Tax=Intoshia linei TaxID=1819745 RepID=A0A177AY67_9BILA|nr:hypothetical protein A3Q56_05947 [Intoshia linei]